MEKLSLSKKFGMLFIPLIATGVFVSIYVWSCLSKGTVALHDANVLNERALDSRIYVAEMGSALKGYLLDPSNKKEAEKKKVADDRNAQALDEMKAFTHNPEVLKLIEGLDNLDEKQLNPAEDEVVDLVSAGKHAEAREHFIKEYLPLRSQYDELSLALAEKANEESDRQVALVEVDMRQSAYKIIFSLICGLMFVALLSAVLISRLSKILNQIVSQLTSEAQTLEVNSGQIFSTSTALSESTTQQAASLQETVSAVEEINAMVTKNAEQSKGSQTISEASRVSANRGKEVVTQVIESIAKIDLGNEQIMKQINDNNAKMEEIIQVISEIGNKTKVINDIVFQTKLLSFNASVEAARAGEHGKGFAVVAEEVGSLAQMSGNAAKEISDMLASSVQRVHRIADETKSKVTTLMGEVKTRTENGSETARRCGSVLDEIVGGVGQVDEMMMEVATASHEQSRGIQEISKAMEQVDQATQRNAEVSQKAATSAESLNAQASTLRRLVTDLSETVHGKKAA